MTLIQIVLTIAVVGILTYALNLIPMDGVIKRILNIVIIIALILWLLKCFGLIGHISNVRIQ